MWHWKPTLSARSRSSSPANAVSPIAGIRCDAATPLAQWVAFGGKGIITENDRAEQRKRIKYNHLMANCLIFHNVYAMTQALHRLLGEGILVREETIRHLSPYLTELINRFGVYESNQQRATPPLYYNLGILSPQAPAH
jgi:Tn3 transposase DDE domain